MGILNIISLTWSAAFLLAMFLMLHEFRFSVRKTLVLSASLIGGLSLLTFGITLVQGAPFLSRYLLQILTAAGLIFFFCIAEKADGRFFFTFFLVDTLGLELILFTEMLDRWLGNTGMVLLISRLVLFPLMTWYVWKYCRRDYLELKRSVRQGWWLYTLISLLYYILLSVLSFFRSFPDLSLRLLPLILLLFAVMPLSYFAMLQTLIHQKRAHEANEQQKNARKQMELLQFELTAEQEYVQQAKRLRHDVRHHLNAMLGYLEAGDIEGARKYYAEYDRLLCDTALPVYCRNETVNALLRLSLRRCMERGVAFSVHAQVPAVLPFSTVETGALFGNLLENAWEAAARCREAFVNFTSWCQDDRLYVEIRNSVDWEVAFREDLPASTKENGGVGLRSVTATLEKHGGMLQMIQEGSVFLTRIIQPLGPESEA